MLKKHTTLVVVSITKFLYNTLQVILSTIFTGFILIFLVICFGIGVAGGFMLGCWEDVAEIDLINLEYKNDSQTWRQHLEVYSSICEVQRNDSAAFLIDKLQKHRLDYEELKNDGKGVNYPGQYSHKLTGEKGKENGTIDIFLREFEYPNMTTGTEAKRLHLKVKNGKIDTILNSDELLIKNFFLEPELIQESSGQDDTTRTIIPLDSMPEKLTDAFIAIEDRRFFQHTGIDIIRLGGAFKDAFLGGERLGATSTLTQQLTRNFYLQSEKNKRTLARKTREILLAFRIEKSLSKSQILEAYLNFIDFGRFGGQQLYGVQKAAMAFFEKEVAELDFHECALLAGIPKGTSMYSPLTNPENAKKRRNVVLNAMFNQGFINQQEFENNKIQPINVQIPTQTLLREKQNTAGHFLDHIQSELNNISELKDSLYSEGLKVYTSIDMSMQSIAMNAVAKHLRYMDGRWGTHLPNYDQNKKNPQGIHPQENYLQAALIAFEPQSGYVKAMVGGREYSINGNNPHIKKMSYHNFLNRAVGSSKRQPGSAFKPIVFAALMEKPAIVTPATIIIDEPWTIQHVPGQIWEVDNYTKYKHDGPVTVRKILMKSINVPTARAAWETKITDDGYRDGIVRIVELAKDFGISTAMDPKKPALTLGSFGMTVLELTSAYGVFANRGIKVEPRYIEYITDPDGNLIYPTDNYQQDRTRVIDEKVAYQITSFLQSVIKKGTGNRALRKPYYITRPIGGKTGTTNENVDAWFVGYSADMVVGVWVGLDRQKSNVRNYNQQGAWAALPIWSEFMADASRGPERDFTIPEGIEFWEIDNTTGLLKNKENCPEENVSNEPFIIGQAPTKICDKH